MHSQESVYPPEIQSELARIAEAYQLSFDDVVRLAAKRLIEAESRRANVIERDIADSRAHYEQTGLHLTNAEVLAWLDTMLEKGQVVEPPACHI